MSSNENSTPPSGAPTSVGRQDVGIEAEIVDEHLASSTSFAPPTFGRYEKLYHRSFGITEALGSESSDHNDEIGIFSVSASWDAIIRRAIDEDSSVLNASTPGKPVGSCIERKTQRKIVDNTEAPYSVHSDTKLLPTVREETSASLGAFGPKAVGRLNSGMSAKRIFPPPISSMCSSSDSTHVYLRQFKGAGRFVLQEVKLPCQNILRASRKNGRLTLDLISHEKSEESSSASSQEFETTTPEVTTLEKTSEDISTRADCGFNKNCTENACSNGEDTGLLMHNKTLNGEEKPGKLLWCADGSPSKGSSTNSSKYTGEMLAEQLRSTSNVDDKSTQFPMMDVNLETREIVSSARGPTNLATNTNAIAPDQLSVRERYDSGIGKPLAVF